MRYDFIIKAEIAHIKLISKAFDILKSISKGEISRVASLFLENKKYFIENKLDLSEVFEQRIDAVKKDLNKLEYEYFGKYLNILQLGEFGSSLTDVKQRFIDTGIIMKNKRLLSIEIKITKEELNLIYIACYLYYKIETGHFEEITSIIKHKVDLDFFAQILSQISDKALGFTENNIKLDIQSPFVNRKAKWAFDICNAIDNIEKNDIIRNIGTLPKLKIIKNG